MRLRSERWFGSSDLSGFIHRTAMRAAGFRVAAADGRPVVGICNPWSEFVNCNVHFRALAQAVKRGVLAEGGLPIEFPTISLGENLMKPTTMLHRNLMAMDVEESIRAYPMDAVVLIGGCDKTIPAELMGAASVDVPAVVLSGGPAQPTWYRGERLGSGTDLWKYADRHRAGELSDDEWAALEDAAGASVGHCTEMGTASTMASVVEALGMSLPGSAAIPAGDARRMAVAEETGRHAVGIARKQLRPSDILVGAAFECAIAVLVAIGGSTNAVLHLLALAGRVGVPLALEDFDRIARQVPRLVNVRPAGEHLYEDLFRAGGIGAVMRELLPLLDGSIVTVTGGQLAAAVARAPARDRAVIASLEAPFAAAGGLAVLQGSLAPDGAVIKASAASERLLCHRGRAIVFDGVEDLARRIDDPDLPVDASSVLILRNAGPRGGPGMPEWGLLPIPAKLVRQGVDDMVRISDARMSGTGFGTVVLHAAPEAAIGGPLALVETGDLVVLDVKHRRLDLQVASAELERRRAAWQPPAPAYRRGYGALYLSHVEQANTGCDFDFLRGDGGPTDSEPLGMLQGWHGGW